MKKRAFSMMITAAMAFTICVGGCCAYAAEADANGAHAGDSAANAVKTEYVVSGGDEDVYKVNRGSILGGSLIGGVMTYYEDADSVSDIVSGIGDAEFAAGTASTEDIEDRIGADADVVTAVTYDAAGVDFDTVGEYDILYRVFINTEDLKEYLEANTDGDSGIDNIGTDYVDICILSTVTVIEADAEPDEAYSDEKADNVIIAEVNELTWTEAQVTSIPSSISVTALNGNYENLNINDISAEIVNAKLYDFSGTDNRDDGARYTYFDRETLLKYMDMSDIDPTEYPGLMETTTDHIMAYYGPITEQDLAGAMEGMTNQYVLQDSENVDYTYDITYDDSVIKDVIVISYDVDVTVPGTYPVTYVVNYDTGDEAGCFNFDKSVTVVTTDRADELVRQGKTVWTDGNNEYGKAGDAAAGSTQHVHNWTRMQGYNRYVCTDCGEIRDYN